MRLAPLSSAAWLKLAKERTKAGNSSEGTVKGMASVPKKLANTVAAAPLKVLWPEQYSGNGGVNSNGCQFASCTTAGLPAESAS